LRGSLDYAVPDAENREYADFLFPRLSVFPASVPAWVDKALGMCAVKGKRSAKHWCDNHDLKAFLAQL